MLKPLRKDSTAIKISNITKKKPRKFKKLTFILKIGATEKYTKQESKSSKNLLENRLLKIGRKSKKKRKEIKTWSSSKQ